MKLSEEDLKIIDLHVKEQKSLRKIPKKFEGSEKFDKILENLKKDLLFHNMDFIERNGYHLDKRKLRAVWNYLKLKLS